MSRATRPRPSGSKAPRSFTKTSSTSLIFMLPNELISYTSDFVGQPNFSHVCRRLWLLLQYRHVKICSTNTRLLSNYGGICTEQHVTSFIQNVRGREKKRRTEEEEEERKPVPNRARHSLQVTITSELLETSQALVELTDDPKFSNLCYLQLINKCPPITTQSAENLAKVLKVNLRGLHLADRDSRWGKQHPDTLDCRRC